MLKSKINYPLFPSPFVGEGQGEGEYPMLRKACLLLLLLILIPSISHAEIKTYVHTVKQSFGGSQSPDDARVGAIAKAKREVLEKAGTYLESLTIVKESVVEKDEILALAAGVLKAEIVSQKNFATEDTFGIVVKAKVDVDTSILEERVRKLLQDRSLLEKYKEIQQCEKKLLFKIKTLEEQNRELQASLSQGYEEKNEVLKKQFGSATQELTALELNKKAINLEGGVYVGPDWIDITNPKLSLEFLRQSILLDPNNANTYVLQGFFYKEIDQYHQAIKAYNQAIRLDPNHSEAYSNRGETYYKLGQQQHAIKDFNKALRLDPNNIHAYYSRGLFYYNIGQIDHACYDYQKACELGACGRLEKAKGGGYCR